MSLKYLFACLGRAFFKLHLNCKCNGCCECDSDCIERPSSSKSTPQITPQSSQTVPSVPASPVKHRKLPKIPTEKISR